MITLLCVLLSFLSFTVGNDYPTTEKPLRCKINEVLIQCPGYCTFDDTCAEVVRGLMRACAAPPPDYKCQPRCFCKSGLVRIDSFCEPVDKCCNGVNEEITDCPAPCDETCNGKPAADCQLSPCFKKGCRCKNGFVRDANGACIPRNQCNPIQCTGPNEEYSECINPCPPGAMCFAACIPGCVCKTGFERKDGVCVEKNESMPCNGPNEEIKKCPSCPPGRICPAIACKLECVCKEGFVRKNGICVKEIQPIQCTGPNEEYSSCIRVSCPPGKKCPAVCKPGCICKNGFIRKNGVCVKNAVIKPNPTPLPTKITIGPKPIEILPIEPIYATK